KDMIREALSRRAVSGTEILSKQDLLKEGDALVERACIEPVPTDKSKPRSRGCETSGMVIQAAAPVMDENGGVLGVLCAGKLLNHNYTLVDRIRDAVFGEKTYEGRDTGTATIFLWDLRISTNVRTGNGRRAIGTCVSSDVYERVLEKGERYTGRAFVVHSSYITAYEPIRSITGKIVGMLYVGILEQPFLDIRNEVICSFLGIAVIGMFITFMLSIVLTKSITRPVNKLVEATHQLSSGNFLSKVTVNSNDEIGHLADTFNSMSRDLGRTMEEKDAVNKDLHELNQRYLDLLGFTTHELKQPLEVLNGYLAMLQNESIGELTTSQQREAIGDMRINVSLMTDMIQKYLQLSKIESGELRVNKRRTKMYTEIVHPVLSGEEQKIAARKIIVRFENRKALEQLELDVDPLLIRIVFSNLFDNAIKYGKKEGTITIGYQHQEGFHRFHVKNEGRGISQHLLSRVFEKFARFNEGKGKRITGTGLGLYNSKVIIEQHQGKIWVESEEGLWADFIFLLPESPSN
ncbi:MAG: cache domain-containing protein, partial [Theionarchaea archaeon]|nr:cache domain-containing protein [Theionarchaea archaeon]